MFFLDENIVFPSPNLADEDGVLAIGGDLSSKRLILAYKSGIFPWYNQGEPIIWYSPPKRMVLFPKDLKVSKSMLKIIRQNDFEITFNSNFDEVILNCKLIGREGQSETWITDEMHEAYRELHRKGYAKSVEVYKNEELVGGLYGIDLGNVFCGESMFSKSTNASKLALIFLVNKLERENYTLIDCQVYNDHLATLGAKEIARKDFLKLLE